MARTPTPPNPKDDDEPPVVLSLLHFNDVYNIEDGKCSRFSARFKREHEEASATGAPVLAAFSGDIFAPSLLTTFTQGEHMVPVLKALQVQVAVFGNHDFDIGLEQLKRLVPQTSFPWLMSNAIQKETGRPLAEGKVWHVLEVGNGLRVGFMGLIESEWLEVLPHLSPKEIKYTDYVTRGRELATFLREEQGVDMVVALTHMRDHNDLRLVREVPEIDVVLGGHDHHHKVIEEEGRGVVMIKSGSDFKEFSRVDFSRSPATGRYRVCRHHRIKITSDLPTDPEVDQVVSQYEHLLGSKMGVALGWTDVDLDARFGAVRTGETNMGNFICDIWRIYAGTDVGLIHSGCLRADDVIPRGPITWGTMRLLLPTISELQVIAVKGSELLAALENGVSMYPKLEGRFPQVSGIWFDFDPDSPPGSRVLPGSVRVGASHPTPLDLDATYEVMVRHYLMLGKDGYTMFSPQKQVRPADLTGQGMLAEFFSRLNEGGEQDEDPHPGPTGGRYISSSSSSSSGRSPWSAPSPVAYTHVVEMEEEDGEGGAVTRRAIRPMIEGRIRCVSKNGVVNAAN